MIKFLILLLGISATAQAQILKPVSWNCSAKKIADKTYELNITKYSFNVLYDEPRKRNGSDYIVVSEFKVPGLPTKFVLDKNNNLRFMNSGFNGSDDGLLTELTAMIELAKSHSGPTGNK